jgi:hypothetical protein
MAIGTPQALLSRSPHQIFQLLQQKNGEESAETTAGMAHIESLRHRHDGQDALWKAEKTISQQQEATNYTQSSFLAGYGAACSDLELCCYQQLSNNLLYLLLPDYKRRISFIVSQGAKYGCESAIRLVITIERHQ